MLPQLIIWSNWFIESQMMAEKPPCKDTAPFSSPLWLVSVCLFTQTGSSFTPFFSTREALHNEAGTVLQWGRCGWTPLNPLMFSHRTVCPFIAPWNERQLCARARRASSVWEPRPVPKFPTVALATAAWGWEACERPLSPWDFVEGGHGQLASGPAKERKGMVRDQTRCGSIAPSIPCSPAPLQHRRCCVASVCGSSYATVCRPALVTWL